MAFYLAPNLKDLTPIDGNCTEGVRWIWIVFRECAVTPREMAAVSMGLIATAIFIVTALPQIIENCRRGIPDQALSPFTIAAFFFGDSLGVTGCILTKQLPIQVLISVLSVACDITQICQFIYFKARHKAIISQYPETIQVSVSTSDGLGSSLTQSEVPPTVSTEDSLYHSGSSSDGQRPPPAKSLFCIASVAMLFGVVSFAHFGSGAEVSSSYASSSPSVVSRRLLTVDAQPPTEEQPLFPDTKAIVGYVLGWCSTSCYVYSRFPQMIKNWKRRSTEGLSIIFYICCVSGNITYGLQIFLTSLEKNYLIRALPWIVGFPGVVVLDAIILFQFFIYRKRSYRRLSESIDDEDNHEPPQTSLSSPSFSSSSPDSSSILT